MIGISACPGREEIDASQFDSCDACAFGASRQNLIIALAEQSHCALSLETAPEIPGGYGLLRKGAQASYLGPVVSTSPQGGITLVEALLTQSCASTVFWDIPDPNTPAVDWAARHGFKVQRSLTRMCLGENRCAGNPLEQFAIAGPELG